MNLLKKLAGQTAVYGLSSVIARILNFLLVPFYTRVFVDTAEYGIVNELYAYFAFFIIVLTYGMETAFFRFTSRRDDKDLVFSTALVSIISTSVLFVIFIGFFYPMIAGIIGYSENRSFILILGLVVAADAIATIPFARLRYHDKALRFALIKLFNICTNIFFNLLFLVFLPHIVDNGYQSGFIDLIYHPEFRVGYVFVSNLIASLLTLTFFIKEICYTSFGFSLKLLKSMLSYALPLLIAGLAGTANEVIDRIMLKFRLPETFNPLEQIGIYGANIKIAVLMTLFIQMFRYAAEPFFFSNEKSKGHLIMYAEILKYFTICGVLIFLFISLNLDFFKLIIGAQYRSGIHIVPIVLLGNLMLGIYYNISVWYKLRELTFFGALFAVCGAIVTVSVNYIFIPYFGYVASAWGHLLAYSVMVILVYLTGRYYYPVPYDLKEIFIYILGGILLYIVAIFLGSISYLSDLFFAIPALLIYVVFVLVREGKNLKKVFFEKEV